MGTSGFGDGAVAFGVGGVFAAGAFFGVAAGAGEMAKVVDERSRKSEKVKRVACFILSKPVDKMALMILEEENMNDWN